MGLRSGDLSLSCGITLDHWVAFRVYGIGYTEKAGSKFDP